MVTPTLPPDFKEFLQLLTRHEVEYLLIGGYAVGLHGYVRTTADLDIWIPRRRANAVKLVAVLREFGIPVESLTPSRFIKRHKIFRMGVPPIQLEIHTDIPGVEFRRCYPHRIRTDLDGVEVDVISLADLKTNKAASARVKDLADLDQLP